MGANRAFARKLSAPKLLKWEIASDRFQAKCNNTKANTSERTRSESCKMTSIIHVNWKQRRCRVFLQIAIEVTLVELCTDRVKLQGVCVCMWRLVRVCHFHHARKQEYDNTDMPPNAPNLAEEMNLHQHACDVVGDSLISLILIPEFWTIHWLKPTTLAIYFVVAVFFFIPNLCSVNCLFASCVTALSLFTKPSTIHLQHSL